MPFAVRVWEKARLPAWAALCAAFAAACAPETPPNPASDEMHGSEAAASMPQIVSLNPCLDAILVEIAAPDQVLSLSHYSRDPASSSIDPSTAQDFAVTGGTAEEIIALSPDIVIASPFIDPATKQALERLGVRIETFGNPETLDESLAQIDRLADLVRQAAKGRALKTQIMRAVPSGVPNDLGGGQVSALLWQEGQIVPGDNTLVWEHLTRFGFTNHAADLGLGQADHIGLERILADPPQLLLVAGGSAGQTHKVLEHLEATRIARFDPKLFYCGGPSIPKAWERLEQIQLDLVLNPLGESGSEGRDHAH